MMSYIVEATTTQTHAVPIVTEKTSLGLNRRGGWWVGSCREGASLLSLAHSCSHCPRGLTPVIHVLPRFRLYVRELFAFLSSVFVLLGLGGDTVF